MAEFPGAVKTWVDLIDWPDPSASRASSSDINSAYAEITAIESVLLSFFSGGWMPVSDTWTYASAQTVNVPSGAASIYGKGTKIRFKQGGAYKYFNSTVIANTLLTLRAGNAYSVDNAAITDIAYSNALVAPGFPSYFSLSIPTWSASGNPFTNNPGTYLGNFKMIGNAVILTFSAIANATSGATGTIIATFATAEIPAVTDGTEIGLSMNYSTGFSGTTYFITTSAFGVRRSDGGTLFTNSEGFRATVTYYL